MAMGTSSADSVATGDEQKTEASSESTGPLFAPVSLFPVTTVAETKKDPSVPDPSTVVTTAQSETPAPVAAAKIDAPASLESDQPAKVVVAANEGIGVQSGDAIEKRDQPASGDSNPVQDDPASVGPAEKTGESIPEATASWSSKQTLRNVRSLAEGTPSSDVEFVLPREPRGSLLGVLMLTAGAVLIGHFAFGMNQAETARHLPSSEPEVPSLELTAQRAIIPSESVLAVEFAEREADTVISTSERDDYIADGPAEEMIAFQGDARLGEGRPVASDPAEENEEIRVDIDPREPPANASEAAAKALAAIPVGRDDRPPVGGVGAGGIHVDRIAVGSGYENFECTGETVAFSVPAEPTVSVCFRVVHQRGVEQKVVVAWERAGEVERRISVAIPDRRTHRTRVYFRPHSVDVGQWTARVFAPDDTEIAAIDFDVVP